MNALRKIVPQLFVIGLMGLMGLMTRPWAAETTASASFAHLDWELACDNTRTCRAAGYQDNAQVRAVSMLLTRAAGPYSPVTAQVKLGQYNEPTPQENKAANQALWLHIDGQPIGGGLAWHEDAFTLSATQVRAVLASLTRSSRIEFHRGDLVWVLSDQGAAAVLLKMDEFQGRLNTPGALMQKGGRKGKRSESQVLPSLPAPVVWAAPLALPEPQDAQFVARHAKDLQRTVDGKPGEDFCPLWREEGQVRFAVKRLTTHKLLLSAPCWRAAYNEGTAYWVINDRPPWQPILVTESGTHFTNGTLSASQKGRGLGDCTSDQAWTWDGQQFVITAVETTGMCRLIAAGGAWRLPTFVTEIQPQGHRLRDKAQP